MKMKFKSLFILAVLSICFTLSTNAQELKFGAQVGYVNSVSKMEVGNTTTKGDPFNGLNLGVTIDYSFNNYIGLQSGLVYSMIRHKDKSENAGVKTKHTSTGHYVTLPVNIKGIYPIGGNGLSVFAFLGPDFIFGVAGKNKTTIGDNKSDSKWYEKDSLLKRFDIALAMGAGLQYNQISLKFGYDLGLLNLIDSNDITSKRNHFNISLGYQF